MSGTFYLWTIGPKKQYLLSDLNRYSVIIEEDFKSTVSTIPPSKQIILKGNKEIWTPTKQFTKLILYQLSYIPYIYSRRDLNPYLIIKDWNLNPTCLPISPRELTKKHSLNNQGSSKFHFNEYFWKVSILKFTKFLVNMNKNILQSYASI